MTHGYPRNSKKKGHLRWPLIKVVWLRGRDLNPRPLGYEPNELPDCSTPRSYAIEILQGCQVGVRGLHDRDLSLLLAGFERCSEGI